MNLNEEVRKAHGGMGSAYIGHSSASHMDGTI
jgi:hypothetical protein